MEKIKLISILYIFFFSLNTSAKSFEDWKVSFTKKAARLGVPSSFVKKTLAPIKYNKSIIEKDRNQVTSNTEINYPDFMRRWLRKDMSRISRGKELIKKHYQLLDEVEKKYKVEKEVIVSLWGTETFYGEITGDYDLIESLSTLTYEGRRRKFFEVQLVEALRLIYKGHVKREDLKGSWAGATGQCQFMPSNILPFAVDFDGDGKKDIWNNLGDVFASIANLLKRGGWQYKKSIGSLGKIDGEISFDLDRYRSKREYLSLGVAPVKGSDFSNQNWRKRRASSIPFKNSPIVLRGGNYDAIMKWNRSSLFAAFNIILIKEFNNL